MKVIFLDVDGVLNWAGSESRSPNGFVGVDDSRVKRLAKIVEHSNAAIVLVSTWKEEWDHNIENCSADCKYLVKKLARRGLRIIAKTTDQMSDRGRGIAEWLDRHGEHVEAWIVLDDDAFADYETYGIMPHLVKTSFGDHGLTDEHVVQAIQMLTT